MITLKEVGYECLQEIFANVSYEQVSPLFDEMDSIFLSLTEGYELKFFIRFVNEKAIQSR